MTYFQVTVCLSETEVYRGKALGGETKTPASKLERQLQGGSGRRGGRAGAGVAWLEWSPCRQFLPGQTAFLHLNVFLFRTGRVSFGVSVRNNVCKTLSA